MKRRWLVSVYDLTGTEVILTVAVPKGKGGAIHVAARGRPALVLQPADVERLRQAFAEARAVALIERGEW